MMQTTLTNLSSQTTPINQSSVSTQVTADELITTSESTLESPSTSSQQSHRAQTMQVQYGEVFTPTQLRTDMLFINTSKKQSSKSSNQLKSQYSAHDIHFTKLVTHQRIFGEVTVNGGESFSTLIQAYSILYTKLASNKHITTIPVEMRAVIERQINAKANCLSELSDQAQALILAFKPILEQYINWCESSMVPYKDRVTDQYISNAILRTEKSIAREALNGLNTGKELLPLSPRCWTYLFLHSKYMIPLKNEVVINFISYKNTSIQVGRPGSIVVILYDNTQTLRYHQFAHHPVLTAIHADGKHKAFRLMRLFCYTQCVLSNNDKLNYTATRSLTYMQPLLIPRISTPGCEDTSNYTYSQLYKHNSQSVIVMSIGKDKILFNPACDIDYKLDDKMPLPLCFLSAFQVKQLPVHQRHQESTDRYEGWTQELESLYGIKSYKTRVQKVRRNRIYRSRDYVHKKPGPQKPRVTVPSTKGSTSTSHTITLTADPEVSATRMETHDSKSTSSPTPLSTHSSTVTSSSTTTLSTSLASASRTSSTQCSAAIQGLTDQQLDTIPQDMRQLLALTAILTSHTNTEHSKKVITDSLFDYLTTMSHSSDQQDITKNPQQQIVNSDQTPTSPGEKYLNQPYTSSSCVSCCDSQEDEQLSDNTNATSTDQVITSTDQAIHTTPPIPTLVETINQTPQELSPAETTHNIISYDSSPKSNVTNDNTEDQEKTQYDATAIDQDQDNQDNETKYDTASISGVTHDISSNNETTRSNSSSRKRAISSHISPTETIVISDSDEEGEENNDSTEAPKPKNKRLRLRQDPVTIKTEPIDH